jgi:hypothetical protein
MTETADTPTDSGTEDGSGHSAHHTWYIVGAIVLAIVVALALPEMMPEEDSLQVFSSINVGSALAATPLVAATRVVRVSPRQDLAAVVRNARDNTTILLAPGTYRLKPRAPHGQAILIENKKNLVITGRDLSKTRLELPPDAKFGVYIGSNISGLTIQRLTISGTPPLKVNTHAIGSYTSSTNVHRVRISDLRIENVAVGISAATSMTGVYDGVTIRNNTIARTVGTKAGWGYGIHVENARNVEVSGNLIEEATRHSIYLARSARGSNVRIEKNLIIDHDLRGEQPRWYCAALVCSRASDATIAHNLVVEPRVVAISVEADEIAGQATENIEVTGNRVVGAHYVGIWVTTGTVVRGMGNSITLEPSPAHPQWCRKTSFFHYPSGKPTDSRLDPPRPRWEAADHVVRLGNSLFVMKGGVLDRVKPRTWKHETCPRAWKNVRGMVGVENARGKGKDRLFIVTDSAIHDVDPVTWKSKDAPGDWQGARFVTAAGGFVHILADDVLHRLSPRSVRAKPKASKERWPEARWIFPLGSELHLACKRGRFRVDAASLEGTRVGPSRLPDKRAPDRPGTGSPAGRPRR